MNGFRLFFIFIAILATGCTYYGPPPYSTAPYSVTSKFDRSWSAAIGAFSDQGVRISTEDRGAGVIQGANGSIEVTGNIHRQADGGVRVEFNTSGDTKSDPKLINRITQSYNSRMGR